MAGRRDEGSREGGRPFYEQAVFRVGVILVSALLGFLFVRQLMIPDSFGQYGRYRGDSLGEAAALAVNYAGGSGDCGECHRQVFNRTAQGEHGGLDCQSCHGPAAKHVKKPAAWSPVVKADAELCAACHRQITGRLDEKIAAVKPLMHSGGLDCGRCHDPHRPRAGLGGEKS
ncbi:MAG: cytochrome c3 family protein [Bacillota bacterium]